jgi:hypothetical protein
VHAGRAARLLAVRVIPPADEEVRVDSRAFTVRKLFDETLDAFAIRRTRRDAIVFLFFSRKEEEEEATLESAPRRKVVSGDGSE